MRSDGAVKPQHKAFVSTAAGSRSKDAKKHNSNASKWCEDQQRPCQILLSLKIITVAAALFTTAACADAFVIVDAAANVATVEDRIAIVALWSSKSISEENRSEEHHKYNSNYLKTYTNRNKNKYNARNCYELMRNQNNRNAIKREKKNIIENYKCVVCTINENITYTTKALTQNNENTDFKDTRRKCEIASNVNIMNSIFKSSHWSNRDDIDSNKSVPPTTTSNTNYNAFLTIPFLTVFWLSISGFATSLLNIQSFAVKMLRIQESLVLCGLSSNCNNNQQNVRPSESTPAVPSIIWQRLPLRKSLPPAQPLSSAAPSTSLVACLSTRPVSQIIFAMNPRLPFTISYVMYAAFILFLLPTVHSDDGDNFFSVNTFSMSPETTTPEFDYASRGQKKFGDKCEGTLECGFPGSICDAKKKSCQCTEDLPVTNHIDKCGKEAAVNETCFFNEQCEVRHYQTECRDGRCACRYEMTPFWGKDGTVECKGRGDKRGPETYIDPAMIGVLVGMALMFIIICVVLRLFSQARWRENRTIFNTPNPRLMNVSLLRDSKLLHGQERRGSRMSVRAPSRQPSMASLRPHSPNPSLGSHSGSASASNASATSIRSTRSNSVAPGHVANSSQLERKGSQHHNQHQQQQQQHQLQQQQMPLITNITANPAAESVAVEIIVPEK
ncbi:uncharacterized protein LOC129236232 isoform X2 [Anastrepha obliqua]|uniref:uncharacterized protein LOC129236232 isoform X2 n=1 Tax=Anastrepha obliqua TaxID=95512 RepID=UPI0024099BFC|nr:uncharacterized protein LOC129236232 isoform X2 [Anastrepha obliqua]